MFTRVLSTLVKPRTCAKWKVMAINTAWKVSVFGVILVRIFPHSDWVTRNTDTFYAVKMIWKLSSKSPENTRPTLKEKKKSVFLGFTPSWRRSLSYRNQSTELLCNQWTGFYTIGTSLRKELNIRVIIWPSRFRLIYC